MTLRIGSLFSGIGGLELGLERSGLGRVVWQVERDEYCRRVLARHWPDVERHNDVTTVSWTALASVDVICGGFPCQPVSVAGKQRGESDDRWLWPEFRRIISELNPGIVVIENVPGLRTRGLRRVLADIAGLGFDAEWATFGAVESGAPHWRRRLWIVATNTNSDRIRIQQGWLARSLRQARSPINRSDVESIAAANPNGDRRLESALRLAKLRGWPEYCGWEFDPAARVHDGVPRGMVGPRRRALGNSVCVANAEAVGRAVVGAIGVAL